MPPEARKPYEEEYERFTHVALSALAAVDTPAAAQTFVTQVAQQLRDLAAKIPEFYIGEFIGLFKDAVLKQCAAEVEDCKRTISGAEARAAAIGVELQPRLDAASAAGDRAAEHAVWGERQVRQAECQAEVDEASRRIGLTSCRLDAFKDLASAVGSTFS